MSHDRARMRGEKRPGAWEAVNCHWVTTAVGFIHSQMNLLGDLINHFFFFLVHYLSSPAQSCPLNPPQFNPYNQKQPNKVAVICSSQSQWGHTETHRCTSAARLLPPYGMTPARGGITASLLPADLLGSLTQGCERLPIVGGSRGAFPARSVTMVAG